MAHVISFRAPLVASFVVALGVFFIFHLPRLESKSDTDVFYVDSDPSFKLSRDLEKVFQRDEFFVVAVQSETLFTTPVLNMLTEVTASIRDIENVVDTLSLANVKDTVGEDDVFTVEPFILSVPTDASTLKELQARALAHPLYRDSLISSDGKTAAIAVFLPRALVGNQRQMIIDQVRTVLQPFESKEVRFHLGGGAVTNVALATYMKQDLVRFIPITLILVLLAVWFLFRNVWILVLGGLGVTGTILASLGATALHGTPLNNASSGAIPIIMALALSDLVHLFSHLDRSILEKYPNRKEALRHVLEQIMFPCLLTSINTAIGFGSLLWNGIPAIRCFGGLAAVGMIFEFIFTFGLVAPLVLLIPPERLYRKKEQLARGGIPQLVRWSFEKVRRRPAAILFVCIVVLGVSGWVARNIVVETNLITYLHRSTPVRQDAEFIRENLGGINTMEIVFHSSQPGALREPEILCWMDDLQSHCKTIPGVDWALSVTDFLKEMNESMHNEDPAFRRLPSTRQMVDQYLLLYSADDINEYVNSSWTWARIRLRLHSDSSRDTELVLRDIQQRLDEGIPPGLTVQPVGVAVDIDISAQRMVGDQISNIGLAVGLIWVVMSMILRSPAIAFVFLLPNLFPLVLNFGLMAVLKIPLDAGTSLIAAAAFGIIVDDTVHFFIRLKELLARGINFREALQEVSLEKGLSALSSSVIISAGFSVLLLSHFLPLVHYALLNLFVLMAGMFGDLFFLKSLLILWDTHRRPSNSEGTKLK